MKFNIIVIFYKVNFIHLDESSNQKVTNFTIV